MSSPIIQIFGHQKCADTRKAERWFKERRLKLQMIDLREKGMSPGELRSVAASVGGPEALLDREGARYKERGLQHSAPSPARIEELLLEDAKLLQTPIVRRGSVATVGYRPEVWALWK
jgi:arsenate reductase (glutaredoxin)